MIDESAGESGPAVARKLAEAGLHAQAEGRMEEADKLLTQAQAIDADAVAEVLREHDAGRAPDARLQVQTDQDVEKALPPIPTGPV
jgi:hypothetical protein